MIDSNCGHQTVRCTGNNKNARNDPLKNTRTSCHSLMLCNRELSEKTTHPYGKKHRMCHVRSQSHNKFVAYILSDCRLVIILAGDDICSGKWNWSAQNQKQILWRRRKNDAETGVSERGREKDQKRLIIIPILCIALSHYQRIQKILNLSQINRHLFFREKFFSFSFHLNFVLCFGFFFFIFADRRPVPSLKNSICIRISGKMPKKAKTE